MNTETLPTMLRMKVLLFLLVLAAQAPLASATVTYAVGTCQPNLPSFATIQVQGGALTASPPPNVVKICPGTYPEQIVITYPVTLEGISDGNSSGATIAVPSGGLVVNSTDAYGSPVAAQVLVENVGGEVNLSNLTVDGTGNNISSGQNYIVGVFYANSPGTINHLTTQNQKGDGYGVGIMLDGGSSNPSVTVEKSNVWSFDNIAIVAEANSSSSDLTATITGNYVTGECVCTGIWTDSSLTALVSNNLIAPYNGANGVPWGIFSWEGSVSNNTVIGAIYGILSRGASVISNTVFSTIPWEAGPPSAGIWVASSVPPVTGNTVVQTENSYGPDQSPAGIDFTCTAGSNVHSNTILGGGNALINVPSGTVTHNTYYSVGVLLGPIIDDCE